MNKDKQRIAIAEFCEWTPADESQIRERAGTAAYLFEKGPWWRNSTEQTVAQFADLPDYLNDLNAMHEAEKLLTMHQREAYASRLAETNLATVDGYTQWNDAFDLMHATATQRAEALLRTIGKWEDGE